MATFENVPVYSEEVYECLGPFIFGPVVNPVCCHGWNQGHFLDIEEVNRTQQLINSGVITHPNVVSIQRVEKVEEK